MFDHMQPSPVAHRCIIAVFLLWMSGCSDQPRPESPAPNIEPNSHWPQLLDGGPDLDETQVQWFDIRKQLGPRIVTLHPFGEMVVLTTNSETILYHLPSGKRWQSWFLPSTAVQFSGDGTKLLTRRKMDFAIWNLTPFQEVCHFPAKRQTLPHNADEARETAARSGQPVAAINYDGSRIVIFNDRQLFAPEHPTGLLIFSDQGELQRTISLPPDTEVRSLRFVGKDNLLMSELVNRTSEDHRHVIWDIATGRATVEFPGDKSVRICDNGKLVLSAELSVWSPSTMRYPAVIQVRETSSGKLKQTVHAGAPIRDITFNPDGTRIWASLQDRLVEWDLSSGQIVFQVSQQEHPFATVDYSPDGKRRFATIEFPNGLDEDVDHLLRGWDVSTGKKLAISDFAFGSFDGMEELFFYQQGEYFIDLNAPFAVRSVTSGAVLQEAITYHQSQRQIPVRRHPWDVPDWAFQLESFGHGQHDLVVSQDGERAVIKVQFGLQTPQTRVIVVDTARPDEPQILQEYSSMVAIRPDHRRFVTATIDALIERDTDAPEVQTELMKLPGRALFANYNSDGSKLIVGGTSSRLPYQYWLNEDDAGWAAVVDVATQQIVSLVGHQAPVTTGEFAPDDSRSATGSVDRTIRLWGNSGESIYVFQGHRGAINKIAFDPMGTRILSAANDGLASWSMAGVVDPDIEPARFVENFDELADIFSKNQISRYIDSQANHQDQVGSNRLDQSAEWSLVTIGNVDRIRSLPDDWLKLAKSTRQQKRYRPSSVPNTHFANYRLHTETANGMRVMSRFGENELVVDDSAGNILATWEIALQFNEVALSADGSELAVALPAEQGYRLNVYDVATQSILRSFEVSTWTAPVLQIAPNNEFILLRTDNHTKLEVRDYQSSQLLANLKLDSRGQPSTEFSLDGEHILTSQSYDPVLYIRDVKTLEVVRTLQNDLPVDWFRLTPDGQHVLVGQPYADGRHLVAKWNIETGQRTWSRVGPASETGFFSKSGQYFLTMSGWNMSAMWDIHNGRPCCVIISESNDRPDQSDFYFSKDERSLHLGSADGYLLWSQEN